jgi:RNase H-fold protein (predicted Holliday junction resolvase)
VNINFTQNILGLDPGRDKCGVAVMNSSQEVEYHQVIDAAKAIATLQQLTQTYAIDLIVMGDGTTSRAWQQEIESNILTVAVTTINETNSTLEARDRYWMMYPPQGLQRLIPQGLRTPPRPVDDIVAIILIERYLEFGVRSSP